MSPLGPTTPQSGSGLVEKLAGAALDRITGALSDEDKADILTDLVDELHNLNVTLDFWSIALTNWSRSGGRSTAALQTCIRDLLLESDPWAEGEPEPEEPEPEAEGEESPADEDGKVIDGDFRRVDS